MCFGSNICCVLTFCFSELIRIFFVDVLQLLHCCHVISLEESQHRESRKSFLFENVRSIEGGWGKKRCHFICLRICTRTASYRYAAADTESTLIFCLYSRAMVWSITAFTLTRPLACTKKTIPRYAPYIVVIS